MTNDTLKTILESAWEDRANLNTGTRGDVRDAVHTALDMLDSGKARIAEKTANGWQTHEWLKKAVLLSFRLNGNEPMGNGIARAYDKVETKWQNWDEHNFQQAGFRAVPGAVVRKGAYVAKDVVLMPSFINIGAHVGEGTMVDTWATIGSCAQIGSKCHISGGVGIGGVLEPLQASPVIIEDNVFIGARSEVAEGVIVEEGAVLSMGVYLGASTRIIDRTSGEVFYGRVPAYSVVVSGSMPSANNPNGPALYCAVIVKRVDEKTRAKTGINELLRD
jgi:2,3,4,5-tetrahydropyridine-2-carboxylate N-succinyltransferase